MLAHFAIPLAVIANRRATCGRERHPTTSLPDLMVDFYAEPKSPRIRFQRQRVSSVHSHGVAGVESDRFFTTDFGLGSATGDPHCGWPVLRRAAVGVGRRPVHRLVAGTAGPSASPKVRRFAILPDCPLSREYAVLCQTDN